MSRAGKIFFICVYSLVAIGIVMTYSASAIYAEKVYRDPQYLLIRQSIYALAGTVLLFMTASIPAGFWQKNARGLVLSAVLFLGLVFIPGIGHLAGGAQRWIGLGMINFQPAEFAKLTVCIYLSDYLARKAKDIKKGSLLVFIPPLLIMGTMSALLLMQPDLGSCAFICLITGILFFLAGFRLSYVGAGLAVALPVFYFLVMRTPYRLSRVTAYMNPWDDPQGSGFQMIQSLLAFGLGGVQGVGLGQSTQKLFYLPSGYNDFIFSITAEELGLVGVLVILGLYFCIFLSGMTIAARAENDFKRLCVSSLTLMIVFQALVNMMVATGLIPTKGLPLPFLSYGGTSLVINLIGTGLLLSLDRSG